MTTAQAPQRPPIHQQEGLEISIGKLPPPSTLPVVETLFPEKQFGYTFLEELGQGGEGTSFLAQSPEGQTVVAKVYEVPRLAVGRTGHRYDAEADMLAQLSHPNIPTFHGIHTSESGSLMMVREYVPGKTLAEKIETEGPLTEHEATGLLRSLAQTFTYVHDQKVLHRDVKPANIVLAEDDAKLLDFGIAREIGSGHTVTLDQAIGTLGFRAPELMGLLPGSPASDMYSLGATIVYALEGKLPEGFTYPLDPQNAVPSHISPQLRNLLREMVNPNMDLRPQNATEVISRLEEGSDRYTDSSEDRSSRGIIPEKIRHLLAKRVIRRELKSNTASVQSIENILSDWKLEGDARESLMQQGATGIYRIHARRLGKPLWGSAAPTPTELAHSLDALCTAHEAMNEKPALPGHVEEIIVKRGIAADERFSYALRLKESMSVESIASLVRRGTDSVSEVRRRLDFLREYRSVANLKNSREDANTEHLESAGRAIVQLITDPDERLATLAEYEDVLFNSSIFYEQDLRRETLHEAIGGKNPEEQARTLVAYQGFLKMKSERISAAENIVRNAGQFDRQAKLIDEYLHHFIDNPAKRKLELAMETHLGRQLQSGLERALTPFDPKDLQVKITALTGQPTEYFPNGRSLVIAHYELTGDAKNRCALIVKNVNTARNHVMEVAAGSRYSGAFREQLDTYATARTEEFIRNLSSVLSQGHYESGALQDKLQAESEAQGLRFMNWAYHGKRSIDPQRVNMLSHLNVGFLAPHKTYENAKATIGELASSLGVEYHSPEQDLREEFAHQVIHFTQDNGKAGFLTPSEARGVLDAAGAYHALPQQEHTKLEQAQKEADLPHRIATIGES